MSKIKGKMIKRYLRLTLFASVAALFLAACGGEGAGKGDALKPTITLADAARKVDDYAEQARRALGPEVKFVNPYKNSDFPCSNADGSPAPDRRDARVSNQLQPATPQLIEQYFADIRKFWAATSFSVTQDDAKNQFLGAENKSDGFTMGLQANPSGEIYLQVSSPCVWRNGTPEPSS